MSYIISMSIYIFSTSSTPFSRFLPRVFAVFCKFPVVSTVIMKSLPPSSELGDGTKFMAPMEALMRHTLQSLPFERRSRRAPKRVSRPTKKAAMRTGLRFLPKKKR